MGDKFAEFEHTPDDSNWNSISGGINSRQQPGGLADKFADFQVEPKKKVWAGIMAGAGIQKKSKPAAFWFTSGVAASVAILAVWSLAFSGGDSITAYAPRINGQEAELNLTAEKSVNDENSIAIGESSENTSKQNSSTVLDASKENNYDQPSSVTANSDINSFSQPDGNPPSTAASEPSRISNSMADYLLANGEDLDQAVLAHRDSLSTLNGIPPLIDRLSAEPLEYLEDNLASTANNSEDTLVTFTIRKSEYGSEQNLLEAMKLEPISSSEPKAPKLKGSTESFWFGDEFMLPPPRDNSTSSLLASSQLNQPAMAENLNAVQPADGLSITTTGDQEIVNSFSGTLPRYGAEEFSTPVYISLNFEKRFMTGRKNRLSLGTGLGALFTNSTQNADFQDIRSLVENSRTYGVLPLYVKYDFISKPKWNMYLSSGGALELGLAGERTITDIQNGKEINSTSSKLELGIGQVNVNTGIGGSVNLGRHFSFFSEVSVAHYIYESQFNFWSSQKLWPSLKTGIILKL
ncbi:MAG: hypothetical protein AB8B53_03195 [Flavobacteriales bacterium]